VSERIELAFGFIEFHQVGDFADIHDVEILPPLRGNGYGTKLMNMFLDEMRNRGVGIVTLEVRVDHIVAIRLYEKAGFECIAMRKGYYKDGCDGLLMRLEI